ncbi:hypothetical protein CLU79DRAFT_754411 [Phycomyces nitens]|nr:hypothetical protein CLU79DRAFT_754411 [Phycomyces nitens]
MKSSALVPYFFFFSPPLAILVIYLKLNLTTPKISTEWFFLWSMAIRCTRLNLK